MADKIDDAPAEKQAEWLKAANKNNKKKADLNKMSAADKAAYQKKQRERKAKMAAIMKKNADKDLDTET
jgi:hypothetical protein